MSIVKSIPKIERIHKIKKLDEDNWENEAAYKTNEQEYKKSKESECILKVKIDWDGGKIFCFTKYINKSTK